MRETLAGRIRAYAAAHPDARTAEIADAVRTSCAYVRVITHQRLNGRLSAIDLRYRRTERGKLHARVNNLVKSKVDSILRGKDDLDAAYGLVYRAAIALGASSEYANAAASRVKLRVIRARAIAKGDKDGRKSAAGSRPGRRRADAKPAPLSANGR